MYQLVGAKIVALEPDVRSVEWDMKEGREVSTVKQSFYILDDHCMVRQVQSLDDIHYKAVREIDLSRMYDLT